MMFPGVFLVMMCLNAVQSEQGGNAKVVININIHGGSQEEIAGDQVGNDPKSPANNTSVTQSPTTTTTVKLPINICGLQPMKEASAKSSENPDVSYADHIVGGQPALFGEWPWQVLVEITEKTGPKLCGGVLLNKEYVLTSARCVSCEPDLARQNCKIDVVLGENDRKKEQKPVEEHRQVMKLIRHDDFKKERFASNDVALLKMNKTVEFQPHIRPICFPKADDDFQEKEAWVTGWGKLHHEQEQMPNYLSHVQVKIWDNITCSAEIKKKGNHDNPDNNFCTGHFQGGKGFCTGDEGGPMVVKRPDDRFVLAGIISEHAGCALKYELDAYMRATAYEGWIKNYTQVYYD